MVKTRMLSNAPQGITSKFTPKRDGPYRIAKRISPVSYQIADSSTGELLSVHHVSDIDAWKGDKPRDDIIEPVRPIRKRGRPKKDKVPSQQDIGSSSRTPIRSKGGVCSAKGPVTRSKTAAMKQH